MSLLDRRERIIFIQLEEMVRQQPSFFGSVITAVEVWF